MRNFILGISGGMIISLTVLLFLNWILPEQYVKINEDEQTELLYIYEDTIIYEKLSYDDAQKIKNIFNGKKLYKDSPSCGFTPYISIKIDDKFFCLACDSCGKVKYLDENKYFSISDEERHIIVQIYQKFGGIFPCV